MRNLCSPIVVACLVAFVSSPAESAVYGTAAIIQPPTTKDDPAAIFARWAAEQEKRQEESRPKFVPSKLLEDTGVRPGGEIHIKLTNDGAEVGWQWFGDLIAWRMSAFTTADGAKYQRVDLWTYGGGFRMSRFEGKWSLLSGLCIEDGGEWTRVHADHPSMVTEQYSATAISASGQDSVLMHSIVFDSNSRFERARVAKPYEKPAPLTEREMARQVFKAIDASNIVAQIRNASITPAAPEPSWFTHPAAYAIAGAGGTLVLIGVFFAVRRRRSPDRGGSSPVPPTGGEQPRQAGA